MTISDKPLYPHPTNPRDWVLPPALGGETDLSYQFLGSVEGFDLYAVWGYSNAGTTYREFFYVKDDKAGFFLSWDEDGYTGVGPTSPFTDPPPPQHIIDFVKAHHKLTT